MMRSLWSGVTGLQAHQIAMDVEGNNISNVNTVGYKYSRANFADILSQRPKIATAPQGELGGQNSTEIGLGVGVISTTRIFSQGTFQTTDKNTDLALQGNGFFIVSPDSGKTNYYTRNGDFLRDKLGNFVNNSGYIVQGWTRDEVTGDIDTTGPIRNIVIKEGLTTPARASTFIKMKGNLDSGNSIGNRSTPIFSLDDVHNARDLNKNGTAEANEAHNENDTNANQFFTNKKNEQVLTERGVNLGVLFDELGNGISLREGQGVWISYADAKTRKFTIGSGAAATIGQFLNGNNAPATRNLNITLNGTIITGTVSNISDVASLINAQYSKTGVRAEVSEGNRLTLVNANNSGTTEETKNIHLVLNQGNTVNGADGLAATEIITAYQYVYSPTQATAVHTDNDKIARLITTTEDLRAAMQEDARNHVDYDGNGIILQGTTNQQVEESLRAKGQAQNNLLRPPGADITSISDTNDGVKFIVNQEGQFQLENPRSGNFDHLVNLNVTGLTKPQQNGGVGGAVIPAISENKRFTTMLSSLEGSLSPSQSIRTSSKFLMSSHGSTVEIHDSLGSKHEVTIKWHKIGATNDGGTEWGMIIQVPEPAEINFTDNGPRNVVTGNVRFNSDGSLASFNPASITFTANNGSLAGQAIRFDFGLGADFDGLTSFDRDSSTDYISQDGYEGGSLQGIKVDESGTIIGAFSNGLSFGLAKVALATFTNNEGLHAEGNNVFSRSANSGDPVIGRAGNGDKGTIAAAKLENSNVDLSRSLTQLIIVQRGFQANSKTITTSDEMLNTLLQLKQ